MNEPLQLAADAGHEKLSLIVVECSKYRAAMTDEAKGLKDFKPPFYCHHQFDHSFLTISLRL